MEIIIMQQPKNFYIKTYGCQMNELDTEVMAGILERRGLLRAEDEGNADLLLFNTCSVRDLAERKVMGKLGLLGRSKQRKAIVGVTGCMANAKKESLFRKLPHIDFVIGTNNIHELDMVLDQVIDGSGQVARTDARFTHELDYAGAKRGEGVKASVSIIRGCDKFCTYCVVPYTRGPEVSRTPDSIVDEVKKLVQDGFKEITLLGQNVNSFGKDKPEWKCLFHDLLYQLDAIPGLERVRYMTSHPVDITRELMEATRDLSTLCEFVHFPIQAGSDRILKKMHRIYTVAEYLEKVRLLKEIVPDVALGTDIIVGFPTETEAEFQETYDRLKEIEFAMGFLFAYSPRKGTPAMRWRDDVPEGVKQDRLQRLIALQGEITSKRQMAMVGRTVEMLVESQNCKGLPRLKGRTRCWTKVVIPGDESLIGSLQKVKITGYSHQTLIGERVSGLTLMP
ncbi:tRNA-2-methylthio-N(6)-dimethylallyladenosine synthase [Chlamydiales bacterium SCGC AG-110-P3]|nr:tRNA-2-methylthio-N(6)-dimethylallyladenosine synthase [Chlamydiales bacterium SCGC AG-110-P3]